MYCEQSLMNKPQGFNESNLKQIIQSRTCKKEHLWSFFDYKINDIESLPKRWPKFCSFWKEQVQIFFFFFLVSMSLKLPKKKKYIIIIRRRNKKIENLQCVSLYFYFLCLQSFEWQLFSDGLTSSVQT